MILLINVSKIIYPQLNMNRVVKSEILQIKATAKTVHSKQLKNF